VRSVCLLAVALAVAGCAHEEQHIAATTRTRSTSVARLRPVGVRATPVVERQNIWVSLDEWRPRYPQAATVLDTWAAQHPSAAWRLAQWSARHREKLEVLVDWAVTHPHEGISAVLATHCAPGWPELNQIADEEPEGFDAFLEWVRLSPVAARELAMHEGGLRYVETSAR
jgi:hypothetical protein